MVYFQIDLKKRNKNLDKMYIKYELLLNGTTWSEADQIEYNTIGEFQTRNSKTPGYYIVWWKGNEYTL